MNCGLLILAFLIIAININADTKNPPQKKPLVFIDGIKAVVRGSEGTDLIMPSELQRLKLDGTSNNLEEMVTNYALFNEAKKYRLLPTTEEIDKQWMMMAQMNRKTPKELDDMVITAGFLPQEARNEFAQMNAINSLVSFKVTGNLIVPEADVVAYYNENPEIEPANFCVEFAFVPFSFSRTKEEQLKQWQSLIRKKDPQHMLKWQEPFWIREDELAADKKFISQLAIGEISQPVQTFEGFEFFRLVNKKEERLKPLDERYGQIVTILRKPKFLELMESFQKGVRDSVSVIYFDLPQQI